MQGTEILSIILSAQESAMTSLQRSKWCESRHKLMCLIPASVTGLRVATWQMEMGQCRMARRVEGQCMVGIRMEGMGNQLAIKRQIRMQEDMEEELDMGDLLMVSLLLKHSLTTEVSRVNFNRNEKGFFKWINQHGRCIIDVHHRCAPLANSRVCLQTLAEYPRAPLGRQLPSLKIKAANAYLTACLGLACLTLI